MILRDDIPKNWLWSNLLWSAPILTLLLFTIWPRQKRSEIVEGSRKSTAQVVFDCDLESESRGFFLADSFQFDGGALQSSRKSRSQKHSLKLNSKNPYGLTTHFVPSDYSASYHLTVWRHNPNKVDSWLVAASTNAKEFYQANKGDDVRPNEDGWEQLHLVFQIPQEVDSLKLYCYAGGNGDPVWFDDFRFEITDLTQMADTFDIPRLDLRISDESFRKIQQKRDDAWRKGLLVTSDDDWVKAKMLFEESEMKTKIRLKGDWLDHLKGTKWSFRIKIKDPDALWGMKTINVQRPETRGFLREWDYHRWLEHNDILTPHYRFVLLSLNDRVLGFYALEEHFEKELVEARNRREGPILKFNEERFWAGMNRQFQAMGKGKFPLSNNKEDAYWASDIVAFKESAILANPNLQKQFDRGISLMAKFKYGQGPIESIFDVEQLGKYLAIVELTGAYHSLTWHNQRWYYNPLSDRLEPIGFDGFTEMPPSLLPGSTILADDVFRQQKEPFEPFRQFFENESVLASYVKNLMVFTDSSYLTKFYDSVKIQMDTYEKLFRKEYFNYHIDWRAQKDRIYRIRLSIIPYRNHSLIVQHHRNGHNYIFNTHHLPLQVIGYVDIQGSETKLDTPILVLPNAKEGHPTTHLFESSRISSINYRLPGLDSVFNVHTTLLPGPDYTKRPSRPYSFATHPLCKTVDKQIVLISGQTSDALTIPEGFEVVVPEGTTIDLTNHAYILSESPLIANGTNDNPIRIQSQDGTGAVMVRRTKTPSKLTHVHFEELGRVDSDGFLLTGGTTFYDTEVLIQHCTFRDNTNEDALNIVRSNFTIENCLFAKTAFDAFDADFCNGTISGSVFIDTGNDAMDFSGSTVTVSGCKLSHVGDKGISVGENSTVSAFDLEIDDAVIGVASKDLSTLKIKNIQLKNAGTGFTAFQKKATFGPAEISVENYAIDKVKHLHIIEGGSTLSLDGSLIQPK